MESSSIQESINKIKIHSQRLKDEISMIEDENASTHFYLGNLKRLSLQAMDLFGAMQKQVSFLNNQKRFALLVRHNEKRSQHGVSS